MKTITLEQVGKCELRDLDGRLVLRFAVDEVGPNWQASVYVPMADEAMPYKEGTLSIFHITAPY